MFIELEDKDIERIANKVLETLRPLLSKKNDQDDTTLFDVKRSCKALKMLNKK